MKLSKVILMFAVVSLVAGSVFATEPTGGLRYSITVTKFDNKAGWAGQWDIGDAWATVLTDQLNSTGKFIVLGEKDMRSEALGEQDFAASGRTAGGKKAPVTGQMTPAQLLVKGAITHVQDDTSGGGGGISLHGISVGGGGGKGEVNATIYIVDSPGPRFEERRRCLQQEISQPRLQRRRLRRRCRRLQERQCRQGR